MEQKTEKPSLYKKGSGNANKNFEVDSFKRKDSLFNKAQILERRGRLNTVTSYYIDMLSSNDVTSQFQLQDEVLMMEEDLIQQMTSGQGIPSDTYSFVVQQALGDIKSLFK